MRRWQVRLGPWTLVRSWGWLSGEHGTILVLIWPRGSLGLFDGRWQGHR